MIYELLKRAGAIGRDKAMSTKAIMTALHMTDRREVVRMVADERQAGQLVCSSWGGGYFLPATADEIREQKKRLEKTFYSRANAVRVFRHACKELDRQEQAAGKKEKKGTAERAEKETS